MVVLLLSVTVATMIIMLATGKTVDIMINKNEVKLGDNGSDDEKFV